MKPSERINQIMQEQLENHTKYCIEHGYMCHVRADAFKDRAIVIYLDEQWNEKRQSN